MYVSQTLAPFSSVDISAIQIQQIFDRLKKLTKTITMTIERTWYINILIDHSYLKDFDRHYWTSVVHLNHCVYGKTLIESSAPSVCPFQTTVVLWWIVSKGITLPILVYWTLNPTSYGPLASNSKNYLRTWTSFTLRLRRIRQTQENMLPFCIDLFCHLFDGHTFFARLLEIRVFVEYIINWLS